MRRLVARVIGWVPLDLRARRAVDETLLDWRYEAGVAHSRLGRVARHLAGLAALARVIVSAVVREVVHVPVVWLVPRLVIFAGLPAALALASGLAFVKGIAPAPSYRPELVVSVSLGRLLPFLPLVMFVVVVWPSGRRQVPRLGLAAWSGFVVLAVGWILAVTIAHTNLLIDASVRAYQGGASLHPPAFADLGWREIAWRLVVPDRFPPADAMVAISGMAAATSALVLLAAALRAFSGGSRWIWMLAVPVAFVGLVSGLFATLFVFHVRLGSLIYWVVAAVALSAAIRLERQAGELAVECPGGLKPAGYE